jgi:4-hydroxy-3-polyprenylbenzoate decarboxylase
MTARTDPQRDIVIIENAPTDTLDPASPLVNFGSKIGIDATTKWKEEGYNREIQKLAQVDDSTKSIVDKKWQDYGFQSDA